ncbi:hypothetical protein M0805_007094 [Coniferiporia weirii]|nr:hypothetical protein M0805_007094 [Coniferiporia weirii]
MSNSAALFGVFTRAANMKQTHLREQAPPNAHDAPEREPSETVAEAQSMESDLVSPTPSLSQFTGPPTPDVGGLKERRAYEVARQHSKHPGDRRKAREQKTKRGAEGPVRVRVANIDVNVSDEVAEAAKARTARSIDKKAPRNQGGAREVIVRLADLISVAKVRKEKAGDFELVPHVRPVVALDDFEPSGNGDAILDFEDWEHVESCSSSSGSSDEDDAVNNAPRAPSYAQVVLSKY